MNKNTKHIVAGALTLAAVTGATLIIRKRKKNKRQADNWQVDQSRLHRNYNTLAPLRSKRIDLPKLSLMPTKKVTFPSGRLTLPNRRITIPTQKLTLPTPIQPKFSYKPTRQPKRQAFFLSPLKLKPLKIGSDQSPANPLSTNNNRLPSNFRNWQGGNSYLSKMPRGIRNNNPGNLIQSASRWKGKLPKHQNKDRRFEMFISPEYGTRAMIKLLKNYITKGYNTIEKIIGRYAPKSENNTRGYINRVSSDLRVNSNTKLRPTKNTLRQLVFSMSKVENGGSYITNALFEKAYAMVNG